MIIATRNRAEILKTVSLPSLAKQNFKDFEVIVWDASDNEDSKRVVEKFKASHPEMKVYYFKAPRTGLTSQRNDAVKVARGDIIFFIDDDSEVSMDGLEELKKEFEKSNFVGVGLPLKNSFPTKKNIKAKIRDLYYWIFRLSNSISLKRSVYLSGWSTFPKFKDETGEVEWLSGCSMAYRKSVFSKYSFQEKLEKFGGYALGEDVYFSHNLFKNGYALRVCSSGYVIHHVANGGRLENEKKVAARFYNQFLIWKEVIYPHNKWSFVVYLWSLIGELIFYGLTGLLPNKRERLKGIKLGIKAILDERK